MPSISIQSPEGEPANGSNVLIHMNGEPLLGASRLTLDILPQEPVVAVVEMLPQCLDVQTVDAKLFTEINGQRYELVPTP